MELIEFLKLFKKHKIIFWFILLLIIFIGFIWQNYQSKFYLGSMAINISREKDLIKNNQQYDYFYRFQADEKFARNIISWIEDLGFIDIVRKEFIKEDGDWSKIKRIKATQLSTSYIKIDFKTEDAQSAVLLGKILERQLKIKNQELKPKESQNWFKLIIDKTHVIKNIFDISLVLAVATFLGLLLATFGVLLRHYFNFLADENRN